MTTRSGRRVAAEPQHLSHIEALLLAQGTWEMGADSTTWSPIAKILSKHPLVSRPKSFFTPQSCRTMYDSLMRDADLQVDEECVTPKSDKNLALAQKYYQLRFEELQQLILAEESAFKTILKEIEDIKAGKWDEQLKSQLTGQPPASQENLPADTPRPNPEIGGGEAFTGSLTGASSSSLTREGSETPIPVETRDHVSSGPQTDPEPPQLVDEMQESAAPSTPGIMDDRAQEDIPGEDMQIDSTADNFVVTDPVDVRIDGDNIEQSLREEEQEEEASKHEGDKAEHDDIDIERDISEEQTMSGEHQQEEDKRGLAQEPSNVAEDQQVAESGRIPLSLEEQAQEIADEIRQQTGDETSEEQEPVQVTRRSTRNRPSVPAPPVTRKTRRQMRAPEHDIQSDAEGEAEHQEEERTSSPVPVEPVNTRRRKRKSSIPEPLDSPRDRKKQRDESEPIDDDEPGPSTGMKRRRGDRSEEQLALKKFQNMISMLHSQITQHRNGNIFHNPIRTVEAPDYHDIVKRPMDLKTIKARVKDGLIANSLEYQRDCLLMFANAMMYNHPGSDVYQMAEDMMHDSEDYINAFRQTEGLVRNRP